MNKDNKLVLERILRKKDRFSFIEWNILIANIILTIGYISLFLQISLAILFNINSQFLFGLNLGFLFSGLILLLKTRIWWLT